MTIILFTIKYVYRSPSPTIREDPAAKSRFTRGGEDWADPWMRSKDDKSKGKWLKSSYDFAWI